MSPTARAGLLGAIAVLPFLPALVGGFVFDDHIAILENESVVGPFSLLGILDSGFWGGNEFDNSGSYRPLAVLSFAIDHRLGGGEAWFFHVTNLLWHAVCVVTVYAVLRRRFSEGVAVACALVFATHALHTENAAGLVARADVMATTLGLIAWDMARSKKAMIALSSAIVLLLALFAKEIAIAFVGLLVAEEVLRLRPDDGRTPWQRLAPIAAMLLAFAVYMILRVEAIGKIAAHVTEQGNPLVMASGLETRLWTASALLSRTIELIIFPASLSADYSFAAIVPISDPWSSGVITGLILWLLLPLAALVFRKKAPGVTTGLLLFLAAYLPIANLLLLVPAIYAERLLYLPSLGLVLAGTCAVAPLWRDPSRRRALVVVVVVLATAHSARSLARSFDWQTPRALFASAVATEPGSARGWFNYGVALLADEEPEEALEALERSLAIYPKQPEGHSYIGVALEKMDRPKDAHIAMYRSVQMRGWCKVCVGNLVNLYSKYGFFDDARRAIENYRLSGGHHQLIRELREKVEFTEQRAREEGESPRGQLFK